MTEQNKNIITKFQNLSYNEKLKFWDDNKYSFRDAIIIIEADVHIHIKPHYPLECIAYNKWIINHWRQEYFSGRHRKRGFSFVYRTFDDYKTSYGNKIMVRKKGDIINNEINMINNAITTLKIKRSIVKEVYDKLKHLDEEEIYKYSIDPTSVLLNLRFIAQIIDLIKYLVFLKNERSLLKVGEKAKSPYFQKMSNSKINFIYQSFIDGAFIDPNTDKKCFQNLLLNNEVPENFFLIWIDEAYISKQVNKQTLFEFVTAFIGDIHQRVFMKRHVKTHRINTPGSTLRDLNTENIKKAVSRWKTKKLKDNLSGRQIEILNIIKTAQNIQ